MKYNGFRSVLDWINSFKNLKDYPWDVKIFNGKELNSGDNVKIVNVTGRTSSAANIVHVFKDDFSHEFVSYIGPLENVVNCGFTVNNLEQVVC